MNSKVSFWERVYKCKHKNMNPNYSESVSCWTPYCSGWEEHCLDCGVFITECGCGFLSGKSGAESGVLAAMTGVISRHQHIMVGGVEACLIGGSDELL
jgi:hypothetical protein